MLENNPTSAEKTPELQQGTALLLIQTWLLVNAERRDAFGMGRDVLLFLP